MILHIQLSGLILLDKKFQKAKYSQYFQSSKLFINVCQVCIKVFSVLLARRGIYLCKTNISFISLRQQAKPKYIINI